VRGLIFCAACVAALLSAGCAKQSPAIARVEGSEPQRISFGDPKTVHQAFTDKMKRCWFAASGGLLAGYRFDLTPAILDSGDGQGQMEQIIIRDGQSAVFVIQFNAFNENTLISTRSQGFPPQIATQMKIDVETWILERDDCSTQENLALKGGAALAQPAPRKSWW
jgi:hypothetical protein